MSSSTLNLPDRSGSGPYLDVTIQNETLRNTLRTERAAFAQREAELLAEIESLKADHKDCDDDYHALYRCTQGFREEKEDGMATIVQLREKLAEATSRAETGEAACEQMAKLKAEKEGSQAMIQIVLQTRLRFLVQAAKSVVQEALASLPRGSINGNVKDGNAAAHAGSGNVDAQLILDGHVPATLKKGIDIVFKNLYRMAPTEFMALSEKEKVAIDCEVTIRTLQVQNDSDKRPIQQRQQALDHIEVIRNKASKMERADFENDGDVTRRLGLVKELIAEIVEEDRKISEASHGGGSPSRAGGRRRPDRRKSSFGRGYGGGNSGLSA